MKEPTMEGKKIRCFMMLIIDEKVNDLVSV